MFCVPNVISTTNPILSKNFFHSEIKDLTRSMTPYLELNWYNTFFCYDRFCSTYCDVLKFNVFKFMLNYEA